LDLIGLPEEDARAALLGAFSARNKPSSPPNFPGATTPHKPSVTLTQPVFPGLSQTASTPLAESLASVMAGAEQNRREAKLSIVQRLQLVRHLNTVLPQHFNTLLFTVTPEPGLVPPMPAPQADRTTALLAWAEGPTGCGLSVIQEALKAILDPE
jgi:hypothetical protein